MRTPKAALALAALFAAAAHGRLAGQSPAPRPKPTLRPNRPPSVKLVPSSDRVLMSCELDKSPSPPCRATGPEVKLAAEAADPDRDTLLDTYTVTVEVDDGNGGVAKDSKELEVAYCPCDPPPPPLPCPTVTVSCPDTPGSDGRLVFTANVAGGDPNVTPTFNWTASAGTITSGQGTSSIIVDAQGLSYGSFTATVEVAGYDRSCRTSSSCTILIEPPIQPRKIDEYGDIP